MNIITLDFETFFSDDYTLKKMTTEAYIRDPRFEVLGCGLMDSLGRSCWLKAGELGSLSALTGATVLCHHAQFDGFILSHHFGIKPRFWLDTLSMARLVVGNHLSVALDALAKHYGLGGKSLNYNEFKGKHWHELTSVEQQNLANGCLHDVSLTWWLFNILMNGWTPHLDFAGEPMLPGEFRDEALMRPFPDEELKVIDLTVRMFNEPVLQGDVDLLGKVWMDEQRKKYDLLGELQISRDDLQSSERFADLIRAEGVEPATKSSPSDPAKQIYAFAKTDDFMKELIEDDGRAGALARARLGVRSTINQTRAERLGFMATRGPLPVYLRYSGAHTTRWSGGDSLNWQNFPRGGDIRRAIKAPEGGALIVLDLSQIECVLLNVLAGQWDVVKRFKNGEDLYEPIATAFYGFEVTKKTYPDERQFGKILELGSGFGLGPSKLQAICRAGPMGGKPIILTDEQAQRGIATYRSTHPNVTAYWSVASRMIARLAGGPPVEWGPMLVKDGRVILPNGAWLNYTTLEYDTDWAAWKIKTRQGWTKLYGGKLVENVVQALARVVLSQAMLRIAGYGYKIATCTHDEVLIVLPKESVDGAERHFELCKEAMERPPAWLPELPVKAEGGISERYEK